MIFFLLDLIIKIQSKIIIIDHLTIRKLYEPPTISFLNDDSNVVDFSMKVFPNLNRSLNFKKE